MKQERIQVLKDILLDLHHGASPNSVQERFNQYFKGVSALEISLMEHELMNSDAGVTFEDVMGLCNVHANLFKGAIAEIDVPDIEQEGYPVYVFKQENLALRAAMLRIRRIIENYSKPDNQEIQVNLLQGLNKQMALLSRFHNHYTRKEKLFFPLVERHGHDSPPKVMWGVDDNIRELFEVVQSAVSRLPHESIEVVSKNFEAFALEFEEMIFKEESILLMILLETLTQDDWLSVAKESDAYGYAIIKPTAEWVPVRENFVENIESEDSEIVSNTRVIDTPEGQFTISFTLKERETVIDRSTPQPFGNGFLSVEQANLILNYLPLEITFVNKDEIFQYYNDGTPAEEMVFKRTPSQVGRNVELCHPPKVLDKVKKIFALLRNGERDKVSMWFRSEKMGKFVYVTYAAVRNDKYEFEGVLEYVQDIQEFLDLDSDVNRDI